MATYNACQQFSPGIGICWGALPPHPHHPTPPPPRLPFPCPLDYYLGIFSAWRCPWRHRADAGTTFAFYPLLFLVVKEEASGNQSYSTFRQTACLQAVQVTGRIVTPLWAIIPACRYRDLGYITCWKDLPENRCKPRPRGYCCAAGPRRHRTNDYISLPSAEGLVTALHTRRLPTR